MFDILKSVGKHFFVYGLGNIANRIVSFILIPVYTHYLSTAEYGTLELLELTSYILGMFLAMGISASVLRFYFDSDDLEDKKKVVATAYLAIWALCIVGAAFLLVFAPGVSNLVFQSTDKSGLFRLVFAGLVIGLANEIPLALIQAQQKSTLYSILSVGRFSLSLGLNILFIVGLGWGILGIILSSVIIQSVFCLFLMGYTLRWSGLHFSIPKLKLLMRYGLPFIPSGIGLFAMNFADRFFLQRFAGLSEVGIYSLGYKFGMILNPLITSPYQTIFRPKMFELSKRDDAKEINSLLFTYFMFIEIFAGLGIAVLIKDALIYISDPEYHTAYIVVPFIVLSYIFNAAYIHAQVGLLITKTTKYVAYIVASSALVNLTLNFLLIRHIGMWGAVISTVSSFGLMYVLTIILSRNVYHVHYQWFRVAKMFVLGGVMYWVSLRISLDSVILSLLLKTVFVLTFPLWLFVLGFYTPKETGKMKELAKQAAQAFQRKIGRSESPS